MRIWDVEPGVLCRLHLLGEHRELTAIWAVLTGDRAGVPPPPRDAALGGPARALARRHELLVAEMGRRGFAHRSPLDMALATGADVQTEFVDPPSAS